MFKIVISKLIEMFSNFKLIEHDCEGTYHQQTSTFTNGENNKHVVKSSIKKILLIEIDSNKKVRCKICNTLLDVDLEFTDI